MDIEEIAEFFPEAACMANKISGNPRPFDPFRI